MKNIICVLSNMKDEKIIKRFIARLDKIGMINLFETLHYCDEETQNKWYNAYRELFK